MSKPSRRASRRNRRRRPDVPPVDLPWQVKLVGRHVGQYCTNPDCQHKHDELPPGVEPFADFAYTVGLFDLFGLPEVHLPAYPDGEGKPLYPGLLGLTVNMIATGLVNGILCPGAEQRVPMCEHRAVVISLGMPGPLDDVSAYQCSDGAECIPARWRIEMTPD
jgi:hypothetical protein